MFGPAPPWSWSLLLSRWQLQPKRLQRHRICDGLALGLGDHAESAAIVPHGPADAVFFERRAYVTEPRCAVLRSGHAAIDAKFVAGHRHVPALAPGLHLCELRVESRSVPMLQAVADH